MRNRTNNEVGGFLSTVLSIYTRQHTGDSDEARVEKESLLQIIRSISSAYRTFDKKNDIYSHDYFFHG